MKFKARAYRPKMKPGQMNKTERSYRDHLELLKKSGEILDYQYEPETLKLGPDCRYTPDYRVLVPVPEYSKKIDYIDLAPEGGYITMPGEVKSLTVENGSLIATFDTIIEFHEVKGTKKKKGSSQTSPYCEDDALVKIKTASTIHYMYKFIIVWKGLNGKWERREIN